jgi:glycosyltransferase involved in cell wall biosynthesis
MTNRSIGRLCYVCGQPAINDRDSVYLSHYSFRLVYYPSAFFPEVILASPQAQGGALRKESSLIAISRFENMRIRFLPAAEKRSIRWLKQWRVLWECVREADVVCVNIPEESGFLAAVICKLLKKPLLVQVLGDWKEAILFAKSPGLTRTAKSWLGDWMTRVTVQTATLVFTQGHALFDKCRAINPHVTQSDFVHSTVTDEDFFLRETKRFHEPLRILTVCRLEPGKGLEVLARSIRDLLQSGLRMEWWCVGQGPSEQALKDLARSLEISESVRFAGYVPHGRDLFEFYRQADIFVLPSFHEGIPNVILEAMAHCMPIVATDVGSVRQVITNGIEGVLLPPGEPQLLAEAILRVANDHTAAGRMGKAAFRKASRYKADSYSQQHRRLIETAFGAIKSAPPSHVSVLENQSGAMLNYGQ